MPHPPLVAAPAFVPRVLPSATLALMANFLALIDDFPSLVDDFSSLIDGCPALMRTVSPPHPVTCRCAVHLWPRYSASTSEYCIDKTGGGEESARLYSCRRCGPFAVVYGPVQGNGLESRTNSCSHTRAYAGPGTRSQHGRNEKPPGHINCGQAASNKLIGWP